MVVFEMASLLVKHPIYIYTRFVSDNDKSQREQAICTTIGGGYIKAYSPFYGTFYIGRMLWNYWNAGKYPFTHSVWNK